LPSALFRLPETALSGLLLVAALWTGGCAEYAGARPPAGTIDSPVGVAVHPSGRWVYVVNSNFRAQWDNPVGGSVSVVDADTLAVRLDEPMRFGSFGARIALGGDDAANPDQVMVAVRGERAVRLFGLAEEGARLTCPGDPLKGACRIDLSRDPFDVLPLGPVEGAPVATSLWMVAGLAGDVDLVSAPLGQAARASVATRRVLQGMNILRRHPGSGEVIGGARFAARLVALRWFLQPNAEAGGLLVGRQSVLPTTFERAELRDLAISPDGRWGWATGQAPSAVYRFDMSPDADGNARMILLDRFDLDGNPAEVVVVQENGRPTLYIAMADDRSLVVLDGETGGWLDRIPLDGLAFGLALDAVRHQRLYCAIFDRDALAVVDVDPASPTFRTIIARIP
jgi:hypothetical protein